MVGLLAIAVVAIVASMGWFVHSWPAASEVMASTHHANGPETSDQTGDGEIFHSSKVYYYKDTEPEFVAQAYRVYYGGRGNDGGHVALGGWRRDQTIYSEWNGTNWVVVEDVGSGNWGYNTSSMNYFNRYDNVFMDGGAVVHKRLKHEDIYINSGVGVYHGDWHVHYLG